MKTPEKVKQAITENKLAIAVYGYKNVGYRGKVYSIINSKNAGTYAIFSGYSSKYNGNTPVLFTWKEESL